MAKSTPSLGSVARVSLRKRWAWWAAGALGIVGVVLWRNLSAKEKRANELAVEHLHIADAEARRLHRRFRGGGPPRDDLKAAARLGLVKAARAWVAEGKTGNFGGWATTTVRWAVADAAREWFPGDRRASRGGSGQSSEERAAPVVFSYEDWGGRHSHAITDVDSLSRHDLAAAVAAIERLPSPEREVAIAYYVDGHTLTEIAVKHGRSTAWASRAASRGVRQARQDLGLEPGAPVSFTAADDDRKRLTRAALVDASWDAKAAAEKLGVSTSTLYRRIVAFGLQRPPKPKRTPKKPARTPKKRTPKKRATVTPQSQKRGPGRPRKRTVEEVNAALKASGGNRAAAARALGITRRTLYDRLDEYENIRAKKGGRARKVSVEQVTAAVRAAGGDRAAAAAALGVSLRTVQRNLEVPHSKPRGIGRPRKDAP
jgi:RNA polymerase sigma factor (sigma-70 family)